MANIDLSGAPKLNHIEFISVLGVGGMSRVYKARQALLDRVVAVKVLSKNTLSTETALKRFLVEAKLTSSLSHPNIVQIMNHGVSEDGQAYIVMEYVEGGSLADVISKDAPISYRRFQNIFIPLLSALEHAHGKSIIHRDIKPSNIIIGKDSQNQETAKLADFGIAKALVDPEEASPASALTKTGFAIGSPVYMSPEQCQGLELDCRSDLYSLACVMYESLSGEPPFAAESSLDVMYKHMHEPRIETKELSARMEIPEILVKAILWGLNKNPAKRPESAAKFAAKLSAALDEITLDRFPLKMRKKKWMGSKNWSTSTAFRVAIPLTILAVAGAIGYFASQHRHTLPSTIFSKKTGARELIQQARKLFQENQEQKAIEYCDKAIAEAKHDSPSFQAATYEDAAASFDGTHKDLSLKSRQKALSYCLQGAKILKSLKQESEYGVMCGLVVKKLIEMGRTDEALNYLNTVELPDSSGNQSWFMYYKLSCLDSNQKYAESIKLWREFIRRTGSVSQNGNFYQAWICYSNALKMSNSLTDAIQEQERLAKALVKDKTPNPHDRMQVYANLQTLLRERPKQYVALVKEELSNNKDSYAEFPQGECRLHTYIGEAFLVEGEKELAAVEFLKALHKATRIRNEDTIPLQRDCLTALLKLAKDDSVASEEYQTELKQLDDQSKAAALPRAETYP